MIISERQKKALEYLDENEGGWSNDKDDEGGPTMYGLTERLAKKYGIKNIATVSKEKAREVFIQEFWVKGLDKLKSDRVAVKVFDMVIHAGAVKAVMILQLCLIDFGSGIIADGLLGPLTIRATNAAKEDDLLKLFSQRQEGYYYHRAKVRPVNRKYVVAENGGPGGWITRARRLPV